MSVLDKSEKIVVDGKEYELKYTLKTIPQFERQLTGHSLMAMCTAAASGGLTVEDTITMLKWGLIGGGCFDKEQFDDFLNKAIEDNGLNGLQESIINALTKSGLVKTRKNVMAPEAVQK